MNSCAPIDRLMQTLLVHAPGATEAIVKLELFNIMDDFFRRTNAWKADVPFELIEGQHEYAIPVPAGGVVVRIMSVNHNDIPVPKSTTGQTTESSLGRIETDQLFPDGDSLYAPDVSDLNAGAFTWAIYRPDYLTVTGEIDAEKRQYPLIAAFSLSLARSCLECECGDWDIPEWMFDAYFSVWNDGTLASLYGMPAKPWSNPQLALIHGKKYRNRQGFHKQEAARGFAYSAPTWRFPRW